MKFKWVSLVSIPAIMAGVIPTMALTSCNKDDRVKVIVDTDIGNDCDDIGALSVLGNAYKQNKVNVLAVTVCNQYLAAYHTTDIMLEQYGIDCPMGMADNNQPVHSDWGGDYANQVDLGWKARSEKDWSRIQSATRVLRKTLAKNKHGKIKLITLGMLNNIANLLDSGPDDISKKTGRELFEENISEVVLMGGRFDNEMSTYQEFNIKEAPEAAEKVINTTSVPKTFCGWEVGNVVKTGQTFYDNPETPQCVAYQTYNKGQLRESWDPLTMYVALTGDGKYSDMGTVTVQDSHTLFEPTPSGNCKFVQIYKDEEHIDQKLESWYAIG